MATEILVKDLRNAFEQARALDGSMAERLDVFADATRKLHPSTAAIVDRLVARLKEHDAGNDAPKQGDVMPPFVLPDDNGRLVSLKDLLAQGPVVVTFHRGHWCPYCRISISTLVKAQPRIEALGARMVAIVPDREQFAAEMRQDCNVNFPILCDMDNGYAMSLNLAIWIGAEMQEYMSKIGRAASAISGQRLLDVADPRHLCRRQGRPDQGTFCRSGLSQAYGGRGTDRRVEVNSGRFLLPVRSAQHFHEGRGDRGALSAGDAVETYVPSQFESFHRDAYQTLRRIDRSRQKADANIGFEQGQQILVR